jgi:predicted MFS family arabinose efflux permease
MAVLVPRIPWRIQVGVYGAAAFSNTMPNMGWVVVPVWLLLQGVPDWLIGITIGCRHIGPMLLAIHGGAVIDRMGARRVMIFLATIGAVTPLLYPITPFIWAIIVLQLITGLVDSLGWVGAQTLVSKVMKGDAIYTGRMSFCTRLGLLIGPALSGVAWDYLGPWGGFGLIGVWSAGILCSVSILPSDIDHQSVSDAGDITEWDKDLSMRILIPRPSDYVTAFKLLAVPTICFVMAMSLLRHLGGGIQASFYGVHLKDIGISATTIGLLISVNGALGLIGSLSAAPLQRYFRTHILLIFLVTGSIVFVAITPLLGDQVTALVLASGARGWAMAASLVFLISIIARYAEVDMQGKAMGLRVTLNQMTWFAVPIVMGFVAEAFGRETSFYVIGVAAIILVALYGLWARWRKAFD